MVKSQSCPCGATAVYATDYEKRIPRIEIMKCYGCGFSWGVKE